MFDRATRESTAVTLYTRARTRLTEITSASRTVRLAQSALAPPAEHTTGSETDRKDDTESTAGPLREAGKYSRVAVLAGTCRRYVEGSWLYRWLTAEPDPDVIVIDLRETWTVGPILTAIERFGRWLVPAAGQSWTASLTRRSHAVAKARPVRLVSVVVGAATLALFAASLRGGSPSAPFTVAIAVLLFLSILGSRVTWTWTELRESRGYQWIAAAFEPPEPPERRESRPGTDQKGGKTQTDEQRTDNTDQE